MVVCDTDETLLDWTCAYCTTTPAPLPRSTNKLTSISVHRQRDDKAFVGYDAAENKIVASFRNTQGLAQMIKNLDIIHTTPGYCSGCGVADSFYDAWLEVGEGVLSAIESLSDQYGTNDILLTGHSLGGAMAAHAAGFLWDRFGSRFNIVGYTFGAPRVGDVEFSEWFRERFPDWFRVVNYNDPVPNLIPNLGDEFVHAPQEIWYYNESVEGQAPVDYRVLSDTNGEDPNGQIETCDGGDLFAICLNFAHHTMNLGIAKLNMNFKTLDNYFHFYLHTVLNYIKF
eukprot:snap_masked-scaffold_44-processed-gene-0.25-mRNA-1 protein AED:1.00 eAED:1.00 QI:0/0/0/0/1/1/2/0/283